MSESVQDEIVAHRTGNGPVSRATVEETVHVSGQRPAVERMTDGTEEETVSDRRSGRPVKASTQKLIDDMDTAPAADEGDLDPEEPEDDAPEVEASGDVVEGETTEDEDTDEEKPVVNEWQDKYTKLEATNRRLAEDLESEKRRPKMTASERHQALEAAEQAYVDEGPIAGLKKYLSVVLGVAHDSPDLAAELSGLYTDLTAQEIGVPLEASHRAIREAARARLQLARDKRERKSEAASANQADPASAQFDQAVAIIDNRLTMQRESGKSFADDHPLLMKFSERLDGLKPQALIGRVIQREIRAGTLDPSIGEDAMIQAAAKLIEQHYTVLADEVVKIKTPRTDTTKSKAADAVKPSTETRQKPAAPKLTNANASAAPAAPPKQKKAPVKTEAPKLKSDKERREYALRHLPE